MHKNSPFNCSCAFSHCRLDFHFFSFFCHVTYIIVVIITAVVVVAVDVAVAAVVAIAAAAYFRFARLVYWRRAGFLLLMSVLCI